MYAFMLAPCVLCGIPFAFHPNLVPSVRVKGEKEPVCRQCHDYLNDLREKKGLERWPEPLAGAYEAAPEEEINWSD